MDAYHSLDTISRMLEVVPSEDRSLWIKIGYALHDEYGDTAFDIWDGWSQKADNYNVKAAQHVWKSFRKGGSSPPATIGTIIFEARRHGFLFSAKPAERSPDEVARHQAERAQRRLEIEAERGRASQAAAAKALEIWNEATPAKVHPYLERKGIHAHGTRIAVEWVKEGVSRRDGEVFTHRFENVLLVPIFDDREKLMSLQAILPVKDKRLGERDKDYLADGRKLGGYFVIGHVRSDSLVVAVCEGLATGASIHEATDLPVMVAFDAGNLIEVAKKLRRRLPDVKIIIAADNDQFTRRKDGTSWNPGTDAAERAAREVGGLIAVPQFGDLTDEPTDFNDLHQLEGLEKVKAMIDAACPPREEVTESVLPVSEPAPAEPPDPSGQDGEPGPLNPHFSVLGHDRGHYFIFVNATGQVRELTKRDLTEAGLIELAPLSWWEMHFGQQRNGKINLRMAVQYIVGHAHRRGIHDPTRMRGRGAWIDDGRIVFHHGEHATIDGCRTQLDRIRSSYVYEQAASLPKPADEALDSEEGERLLALASMFRWTTDGSAVLLLGWVALAPVCGALMWRPHVWLTGGPASGKSTILNRFVHLLLGGLDVFAQGASTEAGIRQRLCADARPVLFDESESNEEHEVKRIQSVLSLIRQASTESDAQTLKGTAGGEAMRFHIRSMFALASIQVGLKHQADRERITVLALRPKGRDDDIGEKCHHLEAELGRIRRDRTLPARLFRRVLDELPTTLKSIKVFTQAAARHFGNQRDGDQYGTPAGWILVIGRDPCGHACRRTGTARALRLGRASRAA